MYVMLRFVFYIKKKLNLYRKYWFLQENTLFIFHIKCTTTNYLIRCPLKRGWKEIIPEFNIIIIPKFPQHCPSCLKAAFLYEQSMQEKEAGKCESIVIDSIWHFLLHNSFHACNFSRLEWCIEALDLKGNCYQCQWQEIGTVTAVIEKLKGSMEGISLIRNRNVPYTLTDVISISPTPFYSNFS